MNVCGRQTNNEFVNQANNISRESSFVRFAWEICVLVLLLQMYFSLYTWKACTWKRFT
jgi:hypothetical protein